MTSADYTLFAKLFTYFLGLIQPAFTSFRYNLKRLTYEERKAQLIERLNALNSAAGNDDDDEDDDE